MLEHENMQDVGSLGLDLNHSNRSVCLYVPNQINAQYVLFEDCSLLSSNPGPGVPLILYIWVFSLFSNAPTSPQEGLIGRIRWIGSREKH